MEKLRDEKKRALNIIWNASEDYSINPEIKSYGESMEEYLYFNYIIGAVHKYCDYTLLQKFFDYLKIDREHKSYEKLMWIGLENYAYFKGKKERPVLEILRRDYSKGVLESERAEEKNIVQQIREAHFRRALGEETQLEGRLLNILNEIEFDENMDTEQIILKMNEIIKTYFRFNPGQFETTLKENIKSIRIKIAEVVSDSEEDAKEDEKEKLKYTENSHMKDLEIESAETSRDLSLFEFDKIHKEILIENSKKEKIIDTDRLYIQKYFGASILSDVKTKSLEQILCVGNHKKTHLHFTNGEFDNSVGNDADAIYYKKAASEQREENLNFYNGNYTRNYESIVKLTNRIRNTLMANFESTLCMSITGKLSAERIWRNIYVNDSKVFTKKWSNDLGEIAVDILLDASASQYERKEVIASQGFIIAESLTRCQIPVKVYSYSSLRNYTIINLYRDYSEIDKNDKIFNYNSSGCNRDGLAIRTALHMMEGSQCEHKILIVLSDCKPNDIQSIPATGYIPVHSEYSGAAGVNDTAMEVKKGINNGVSILCVFTGLYEDVPSAKKIYGHNFAKINSPERFADIVGVLIQNQLKSL